MSPDDHVMPFLLSSYPKLYPKELVGKEIKDGGVESGTSTIYTMDIDRVFEDHNMAAVTALLNVLYVRLVRCRSCNLHVTFCIIVRSIRRSCYIYTVHIFESHM